MTVSRLFYWHMRAFGYYADNAAEIETFVAMQKALRGR